ncbi:MAG: hypothetical protein HY683_01615 [Chloroflexi bacterium]|nr:hypothetical protein [Chloroflexota bacterium]
MAPAVNCRVGDVVVFRTPELSEHIGQVWRVQQGGLELKGVFHLPRYDLCPLFKTEGMTIAQRSVHRHATTKEREEYLSRFRAG